MKWKKLFYHQGMPTTKILLTLSHHLFLSPIILGKLSDGCKFLLFGQYWCIYVWEFIGECCLWIHLYLPHSTQYALLILLEWFVWWKVSDCTTAVLWGAASWICSNQHVAFLCSYHVAFFKFLVVPLYRERGFFFSSSFLIYQQQSMLS